MSSFIFSSDHLTQLRRFPRSFFVAAATAAFLFLGTAILVRWWFSSALKIPSVQSLAVKELSPAIEILFLGSSHVETNVDPRLISRPSVNLSVSYMDYSRMRQVLYHNLHRAPNVKRVFIEWAIGSMLLDTLSFYPGSRTELEDMGVFESTVDRFFSPILRRRLTPKGIVEFRRERAAISNNAAHVPGFMPNDLKFLPERDMQETRMKIDRILKTTSKKLQERNFSDLVAMIVDLRNQGNAVAMIAFPMQRDALKLTVGEWLNLERATWARLAATLREYKVELWDFSQSIQFIDSEFRDSDHLNSDGARRLSKNLDAIISTGS